MGSRYNKTIRNSACSRKECWRMTARERILALRLMEKAAKNPGYTNYIGVSATMWKADSENKKRRKKNV